MNEKQLIDHEVRLQVQEKLNQDIRDILNHMDNKIDNQFKWIMGVMITFFLYCRIAYG